MFYEYYYSVMYYIFFLFHYILLIIGKQSWPELVGKPAATAKRIIEKENPIAKVQFLFPGMVRPLNYVCGRVFVVVNWKLIVRDTPSMG